MRKRRLFGCLAILVGPAVGGQAITFEGDKVRAIYFGAAPAPAAWSTTEIFPRS